MNKKHYRRVFKSDHLSTYDLEDFLEAGALLEFTIKKVEQFVKDDQNKNSGVKVAGKTISANIAHFVEPIKPMVLNATNSAVLSKMTGSSFVDDWKNIPVELFILKNIRFGKDNVEGIRIKEEPPKALTKTEIEKIKIRISNTESQKELNALYASMTSKEKANKDVLESLKDRQVSLKQVG